MTTSPHRPPRCRFCGCLRSEDGACYHDHGFAPTLHRSIYRIEQEGIWEAIQSERPRPAAALLGELAALLRMANRGPAEARRIGELIEQVQGRPAPYPWWERAAAVR